MIICYKLADYSGYDVYHMLFNKWSEYMRDIDDFISPYYHRIHPVYMLRKYLTSVGFSHV